MEFKTWIMLGVIVMAIILLIRELREKKKAQVLVLGLLLTSFVLVSGCSWWNAFKPTSLVKHPDSPMLLQKAKPGYLRVAVYDSIQNIMVDYGWIKVDQNLEGWTLKKFDWQQFIKDQETERGHN